MKREEFHVEGMAVPLSHYADAVRAGDLLFVSGVVPVDGEGKLVGGDDVVAQAERVFESIGAVLAAAGASARDVVNLRTESSGKANHTVEGCFKKGENDRPGVVR